MGIGLYWQPQDSISEMMLVSPEGPQTKTEWPASIYSLIRFARNFITEFKITANNEYVKAFFCLN